MVSVAKFASAIKKGCPEYHYLGLRSDQQQLFEEYLKIENKYVTGNFDIVDGCQK